MALPQPHHCEMPMGGDMTGTSIPPSLPAPEKGNEATRQQGKDSNPQDPHPISILSLHPSILSITQGGSHRR